MRQQRTRNEGFFQQQQQQQGGGSGGGGVTGGGVEALLRAARRSGSLNLSQRSLQHAPAPIFRLDQHAEEGEKFWEFCSVSEGGSEGGSDGVDAV
jgi:hypothetical protein